MTSDVAWALAFCLESGLCLDGAAGKVLAQSQDDFVTLQAIDMSLKGLLPRGFTTTSVSKFLKDVDLDGEHWLLGYEVVRHGFLAASKPAVRSNTFFNGLLTHRITFYRRMLPSYAMIVHPGGGPDWVVRVWLRALVQGAEDLAGLGEMPILDTIKTDLEQLADVTTSHDELVADLLDVMTPREFEAMLQWSVSYG